ncbi:hypothetical protein E5D57_013363 [Metarhizium anisopliae]|nr:hypothetical protein E5D57_013363 [Metarhizium anisopliae]
MPAVYKFAPALPTFLAEIDGDLGGVASPPSTSELNEPADAPPIHTSVFHNLSFVPEGVEYLVTEWVVVQMDVSILMHME